MASSQVRTAVLLLACIAMTAAPSLAQRGDRRSVSQGRAKSQIRIAPQRQVGPQRQVAPPGRVQVQLRAAPRGRITPNPWPGRGSLRTRTYNAPRYGYRPYVNRSYVLPYGYRPYGYRPGWSLNLYFGPPYSAYGYSAYPSTRDQLDHHRVARGDRRRWIRGNAFPASARRRAARSWRGEPTLDHGAASR